MNLSNKKLLIIDRGHYTDVAMHCGKFCETYYNVLTADPYENSPRAQIGKGLPGVKWVGSYEEVLDRVDAVFFTDVYDGKKQEFLRSKGYPVCGCGASEKAELKKDFFFEEMDRAGLPVPDTYRAEGLDDLWEYLKDKKPGEYFIKSAEQYRGDWETEKFYNRHQLKLLINNKRQQLGEERAKEIELLVQRKIESEVEVGVDGFSLNGRMPKNSAIGYEIKDEGIIERIFPEYPENIQAVLDKMTPMYRRLGGDAGSYSLEMRITGDGDIYPLDATKRCANPPTALLCKMYGKSYVEALFALASGEMPELRPEHEYGAEIVLYSKWLGEDNELHIGCPDGAPLDWLALKSAVRKGGQYYRVPNDNCGNLGSVRETGKTWEDAAKKAVARIDELDIAALDCKRGLFDEAEKAIKAGRKFGIEF